jgi:glycosyltransferase involved in cell wall biosynthesis
MDVWPDSILLSGLVGGHSYKAIEQSLQMWTDLTYRKASAIACTTQGAVDLLVQRGVAETKLHCIPGWIDEGIYYPAPYDWELGEKLGILDKFTLLYAGSLGSAQALDQFLVVCERLREVEGLRILIAGSGVLESQLRRHAKVMKLDNVRFLGQWAAGEMGRLLSVSDLNLLASSRQAALSSLGQTAKSRAL